MVTFESTKIPIFGTLLEVSYEIKKRIKITRTVFITMSKLFTYSLEWEWYNVIFLDMDAEEHNKEDSGIWNVDLSAYAEDLIGRPNYKPQS